MTSEVGSKRLRIAEEAQQVAFPAMGNLDRIAYRLRLHITTFLNPHDNALLARSCKGGLEIVRELSLTKFVQDFFLMNNFFFPQGASRDRFFRDWQGAVSATRNLSIDWAFLSRDNTTAFQDARKILGIASEFDPQSRNVSSYSTRSSSRLILSSYQSREIVALSSADVLKQWKEFLFSRPYLSFAEADFLFMYAKATCEYEEAFGCQLVVHKWMVLLCKLMELLTVKKVDRVKEKSALMEIARKAIDAPSPQKVIVALIDCFNSLANDSRTLLMHHLLEHLLSFSQELSPPAVIYHASGKINEGKFRILVSAYFDENLPTTIQRATFYCDDRIDVNVKGVAWALTQMGFFKKA
ncbi:MAG: hypothetical protein HYX48_01990 [Chlamydiales bacterium]|nr:hypothetical protein [Chlamydiales bacterium]